MNREVEVKATVFFVVVCSLSPSIAVAAAAAYRVASASSQTLAFNKSLVTSHPLSIASTAALSVQSRSFPAKILGFSLLPIYLSNSLILTSPFLNRYMLLLLSFVGAYFK